MLTALVIPVSANLQASLVAVLSHKRTYASHQTEPQYLKLYPAVQRQFCYATLPQKTSLCNTLCPSVSLSVSCLPLTIHTPWGVRLRWLENAYTRPPPPFWLAILTSKLGQTDLVFGVRPAFIGVGLRTRHYKCLRAVVTICDTVVNIQTHTYRQTAF